MRSELRTEFLLSNGFDLKNIQLFTSDASARKYFRCSKQDQLYVLMDASWELGEDVTTFITVANYLQNLNLSPPEIIAADEQNGFILLEDLGNDLFASVLADNSSSAKFLYAGALDVLHKIQRAPSPDFSAYDTKEMADLSALSIDWYARNLGKTERVQCRQEFTNVISKRLMEISPQSGVTQLRDYHAENLLWLPERKGLKRVGLLDFQDATLGFSMYDVVSLLQDVRRDIHSDFETSMFIYFCKLMDFNIDEYRYEYHLVGLQRSLRILGVFARLSIRDEKSNYLRFMPKVWRYVKQNLQALNDKDLEKLVLDILPEPNSSNLQMLPKLNKH